MDNKGNDRKLVTIVVGGFLVNGGRGCQRSAQSRMPRSGDSQERRPGLSASN